MKTNVNIKLNNKGFTLVELLATMAILAVLMLIAIPNIVGVVQRSRNKTYVDDAKKMLSLAKYAVKKDVQVRNELDSSGGVCLYLRYLDKGKEIQDAPNGGEYFLEKSYVEVTKYGGEYTYYIQLLEHKTSDAYDISNVQGLTRIDSIELSKDIAYKNVENNVDMTASNIDCNSYYKFGGSME